MAKKAGRGGRMLTMVGIGSAGVAGGVLVSELGWAGVLKIEAVKKWADEETTKDPKTFLVPAAKTGVGLTLALVPAWGITRFWGKRAGRLAYVLWGIGVFFSAWGRRVVDWSEEMADTLTEKWGKGGPEDLAARKLHRRLGAAMAGRRGMHGMYMPANGGVENLRVQRRRGGVENLRVAAGGVEGLQTAPPRRHGRQRRGGWGNHAPASSATVNTGLR